MNTKTRYGWGRLGGAVAMAVVAAIAGFAVFRWIPHRGPTSSGRDDGAAGPSLHEAASTPDESGVALAADRAIREADVVGDGGDPNKALPNAMRPQLMEAIQGLKSESDPSRHRELLDTALDAIRDADLAAAMAVLTEPEFASSGHELRQRLLERWGATDPRAASAWIGRMSSGEAREEAYGDVARGWAKRDVDAARTWALGVAEPSERDGALIQVAYELARSRPVEAMHLAIEMQPTVRRDELLTFAATQWASRAPDDAVDWAAKVEEETLRNRLLKDIFTEWGDRDPLQAATAAVKSMPEGREQNDTVVGIVQRWAQTEPKIAGAWVAAFPDSDLRETAGRELVTIWADQAVEEAGQWLDALPGGGFRDTAVSAYVDKILPMVPDTAAVWAMQIGDPVRRAEVLERVGTEWLESDAAAARVWIANSALSPEAKARLLTPPKSTVPGAEPAAAAGSPSRSQGVGKAAGS